MNRLSPWIRRSPRPAFALAGRAAASSNTRSRAGADWSEDLRMFATVWLGGLVFFGTFLA